MSARATLLADLGEAAESEEFFRCSQFLAAEGVTHTFLVEGDGGRAAIPLVVREIPAAGGELDAASPYAYPGGELSGEPIDPAAVDWSATGLVSAFLRDRLGEPPTLRGGTERSVVLLSDPELPRKSRMSDRQQIRKNEAAGYEARAPVPGPEADAGRRAGLAAVYAETMEAVGAAERYRFGAEYFDRLLDSPRSWLCAVDAPEGEVAAAAIAVLSDGFLHYYLSGTASAHRRRAPSKNLITAATELAESLGVPLNLGGGMKPGDGLEEFKRGFANRELPFRTHELVCDPEAYRRLSGGREVGDFFPAYRAP